MNHDGNSLPILHFDSSLILEATATESSGGSNQTVDIFAELMSEINGPSSTTTSEGTSGQSYVELTPMDCNLALGNFNSPIQNQYSTDAGVYSPVIDHLTPMSSPSNSIYHPASEGSGILCSTFPLPVPVPRVKSDIEGIQKDATFIQLKHEESLVDKKERKSAAFLESYKPKIKKVKSKDGDSLVPKTDPNDPSRMMIALSQRLKSISKTSMEILTQVDKVKGVIIITQSVIGGIVKIRHGGQVEENMIEVGQGAQSCEQKEIEGLAKMPRSLTENKTEQNKKFTERVENLEKRLNKASEATGQFWFSAFFIEDADGKKVIYLSKGNGLEDGKITIRQVDNIKIEKFMSIRLLKAEFQSSSYLMSPKSKLKVEQPETPKLLVIPKVKSKDEENTFVLSSPTAKNRLSTDSIEPLPTKENIKVKSVTKGSKNRKDSNSKNVVKGPSQKGLNASKPDKNKNNPKVTKASHREKATVPPKREKKGTNTIGINVISSEAKNIDGNGIEKNVEAVTKVPFSRTNKRAALDSISTENQISMAKNDSTRKVLPARERKRQKVAKSSEILPTGDTVAKAKRRSRSKKSLPEENSSGGEAKKRE